MLRHILLIVTYFTQWFIYNSIHDDASMATVWRDRDKKTHGDLNYVRHKAIHINLPIHMYQIAKIEMRKL